MGKQTPEEAKIEEVIEKDEPIVDIDAVQPEEEEKLLEDTVAEEEEILIPKSEYDLVVSVLNEVLDRERIDFVQKTKYRKKAGI